MISTGRRATSLLALATAGLLALTACTATVPGEGRRVAAASASASPTPDATTDTADDLVRRARNVLLSGDVVVEGRTVEHGVAEHITGRYAIDSSTAALTVGSLRIQIRYVENVAYLNAPSAFWAGTDIPGAKAVTSGQWVKAAEPMLWPVEVGTVFWPDEALLPDSTSKVTMKVTTPTAGTRTEIVTDARGWKFTITDDPAVPVVSHVSHAPDTSFTVTHPTDHVTVTAPPANLVVTLPGI